MRYVKNCTVAEEITLRECMKNHPISRCRTRAHAILLSLKGFKINELASIFEVDRDTVSSWLTLWERSGIMGVYDEPKSGRPKKLTQEEQDQALELVRQEPRSVKTTVSKFEQISGKIVSPITIKRLLKGCNHIWKRVRASVKNKRDEAQFQKSKAEIRELSEKHKRNEIDLYYFDESGFTLKPVIPYAWQPKNEVIEVPSNFSQRINVLGLLSPSGELSSFIVQGTVNSEVVIACLEDLSQSLSNKTYVILDNAAQHTSGEFKRKIKQWEERGLFLYYLPPYSPELNLIENLWRFIKHYWIPFKAYLSLDNLKYYLEEVLKNVGKKYRITFV